MHAFVYLQYVTIINEAKRSSTFALLGCMSGCSTTRSGTCTSARSPARRTKVSVALCSSPRVKVVVFLTIRVVTDRIPELGLREVLVVSTVEPSTSVLSWRRVCTACRWLTSLWGTTPPLTSSLSPPSRVPCTKSRFEPPAPFINLYMDMLVTDGTFYTRTLNTGERSFLPVLCD
jgi:hypothetical protein